MINIHGIFVAGNHKPVLITYIQKTIFAYFQNAHCIWLFWYMKEKCGLISVENLRHLMLTSLFISMWHCNQFQKEIENTPFHKLTLHMIWTDLAIQKFLQKLIKLWNLIRNICKFLFANAPRAFLFEWFCQLFKLKSYRIKSKWSFAWKFSIL